MSRPRSPETEIRQLKRDLARLKELQERTRMNAVGADLRAKNAEKDRDEWKKRFDTLLNKLDAVKSDEWTP